MPAFRYPLAHRQRLGDPNASDCGKWQPVVAGFVRSHSPMGRQSDTTVPSTVTISETAGGASGGARSAAGCDRPWHRLPSRPGELTPYFKYSSALENSRVE
ncbi:unnamed protein product [Chrysodeixis includens]|uniref:Uncharacterized protein n=1 Tax=Chrysodeixis includens TaxID=689277 RepID=A0A9N8KZF1_CHRIL|nr:unnamed protein product [Chrysodeixis includens]